ncbi:MAG: hypothetical protein ACOYZ7_00890 [Chloroflexota bacterium]
MLLPLSAYANALDGRDVPLDRFITQYYRDRGVELPLGPMLAKALAQGGSPLPPGYSSQAILSISWARSAWEGWV